MLIFVTLCIRNLKNGYYSIEESGVHTLDRGVLKRKKKSNATLKPIAGCEELSLEECNEELKGYALSRIMNIPNCNIYEYNCGEHIDCDHRIQR